MKEVWMKVIHGLFEIESSTHLHLWPV